MYRTFLSLAALLLIIATGCFGSSGSVIPDDDNHHAAIAGIFDEPQQITETCLECHGDVADPFMETVHWTWVADEIVLPGGTGPEPYGKINSINNFCISVPGNWARCTQ